MSTADEQNEGLDMHYKWATIQDVKRSWDPIRWISIEPKWLVARHLMGGGWKWHSPGFCRAQGELLARRVKVRSDLATPRGVARALVCAYQGMYCLLDLFNRWGVTEKGPKNDKAREILDSQGYAILVKYFDLLTDDIDLIQTRGFTVLQGSLTADQFSAQFREQTFEAQVMLAREYVRRVASVKVKLRKQFPTALNVAVKEATKQFIPELSLALQLVQPDAIETLFKEPNNGEDQRS